MKDTFGEDWGKYNTIAIEYEYALDDDGQRIVTDDKGKQEYSVKSLNCIDIFANNKGCVITTPSKYSAGIYQFINKPSECPVITKSEYDRFIAKLKCEYPLSRADVLLVEKSKLRSEKIQKGGVDYCEILKILLKHNKVTEISDVTVNADNRKYWRVNCFFHNDSVASGIVNDDNSFHCFACDIHLSGAELLERLEITENNLTKDNVTLRNESLLQKFGIKSKEENGILKFNCDARNHPENELYTARVFGNKVFCSCGKFDRITEWLELQRKAKKTVTHTGQEYIQYGSAIITYIDKEIKTKTGDIIQKSEVLLIGNVDINYFGMYINPVYNVAMNENRKYYIDFCDRFGMRFKKTAPLDDIVKIISDYTFDTATKKHLENYLKNLCYDKISFFNRVGFYYNKQKKKILFSNSYSDVVIDKINKKAIEASWRVLKKIVDYYPDRHKAKMIYFSCVAALFGLVAKQNNAMSRMLYLFGAARSGKTSMLHLFTLPFFENEYNETFNNEMGGDSAATRARLFKNADRTSLPLFIDESDCVNFDGFANAIKVIAGQQLNGRVMAYNGEEAINNVYTTYLLTSNTSFNTRDAGVYRRIDFIEFTPNDILKETIQELNNNEEILLQNADEYMKAYIKFAGEKSVEIVEILKTKHTLAERGNEILKMFADYYKLDKSIFEEIELQEKISELNKETQERFDVTEKIIQIVNNKIKQVVRDAMKRLHQSEEYPKITKETLNAVAPEWLVVKDTEVYITKDIDNKEIVGSQISWSEIKYLIQNHTFMLEGGHQACWSDKVASVLGNSQRVLSMDLDDFYDIYVHDKTAVISRKKTKKSEAIISKLDVNSKSAIINVELAELLESLKLKINGEGKLELKENVTMLDVENTFEKIMKMQGAK